MAIRAVSQLVVFGSLFCGCIATTSSSTFPRSPLPQTDAASKPQPGVESFEYIVVGSGPGGGPLAANLARAGHSVLMLEAGDDQGDTVVEQLGLLAATASETPELRWDFFVKHYSNDQVARKDPKMTYKLANGTLYVGLHPPAGAKQLGIYYPRAGTLGGCSTHNALQTVYPDDADWNEIAAITGDTSWAAANMRKYFERIENNLYLPKDTPGHGFSGYFYTNQAPISTLEKDANLIAAIKGGAAAVGSTYSNFVTADINNHSPTRDQMTGMFRNPNHMDAKGRRVSSRTYLVDTANVTTRDGKQRYPLTIRTKSLVTKVLFNKTQAIGVEYLAGQSIYRADPRSNSTTNGTAKQVYATREVVIAGGAFNTPQILKLSGIGPAAELKRFNIPIVANLSGVGTNLQDHYEIAVLSKSPAPFTIYGNCTFLQGNDPCFNEWQQNGTGPYLFPGFVGSGIQTSSVAEDAVHDVHLYGGPLFFRGFFPGYSTAGLGINDNYFWSVLHSHARNQRKGTVMLTSADPRDVPEVNFRYFSDGNSKDEDAADDLQALAEGVALARKAFKSEPAPYTNQTELLPGTTVKTDAQVKQYIMNEAFSHHASSSASIGADDDANAVLDSKFRVRGVKGLRVVDASAFPKAVGSFPILAVFMLSEKATDAVLADVK